MKRELAEAVVACLRLSADAGDTEQLRSFGPRDWQRTLTWLDDSGLTLYLLQHLKNVHATDVLSPEVLAQLEGRVVANRLRWEYLAEQLDCINQGFERAGIAFAVVKGLSLVPDYCPDALLRAPSDLDYLVSRQSLPLARQVLEGAGYRLTGVSDGSSKTEFKFCKPNSRRAIVSDSPYSVETAPLIELHVNFWNPGNGVPIQEPVFPLQRTILHSWRGLCFPVLNDRDAFLVQIIHVFEHILDGWLKLCWLLEIGFFMSRRGCDSDFWSEVDSSMQAVPRLVECAAVVIELAKLFFASPSPDVAENWMHALCPPVQLWLNVHARTWVFDDHPLHRSSFFPTAKLALFLYQEFIPDPKTRRTLIRQRLFPLKRPAQISFPLDGKPEIVMTALRLHWRFVLDRIIFHAGSSLRYIWEVPRWRRLMS